MSQKMRAIVVDAPGEPSVLKLREIDIPEPASGQVRIKVAYCALNPLDTHSRAARVKWGAPTMPYTPGYEYAGLVDAIADDVDEALLGKRVVAVGEWGGNAEYALATGAKLIPVPDAFDWKTAAVFATCAPTAWHLVHSAGKVKEGDVVVVHSAAGAVGALTTQIAKDAGGVVYGLVGSQSRAEYAKQFGAVMLIDRVAGNWADVLLRLTNDRGANVIFDGVAGPDATLNYRAVAPMGNVIYLGQMAGPPPDVNISQLIGKSFSVSGFVQYFHQAATGRAEEEELFANLASGKWRIPVERIEPLEKVAELHTAFEGRALLGRTLIEVGGEI
jgi:NADPH2:quinone reductase